MNPPKVTAPRAGAPEPTPLDAEHNPIPGISLTARAVLAGQPSELRGTPIRDYEPDLTAEDYAAIARVRDEIRSRIAYP